MKLGLSFYYWTMVAVGTLPLLDDETSRDGRDGTQLGGAENSRVPKLLNKYVSLKKRNNTHF